MTRKKTFNISTLYFLLFSFCIVSLNLTAQTYVNYTNPVFEDGRDPKLAFKDGYYYYVMPQNNKYCIWKTDQLSNLGTPKEFPDGVPLMAPIYVERLNGHVLNKWYLFGPGVWECNGGDPYTGSWSFKQSLFGLEQFRFDYNAFMYKGHLYLTWAGTEENRSDWWFESVFIAEIFYDGSSFSMPNSKASFSNMLAAQAYANDQEVQNYGISKFHESDAIVEAPAVYMPSQFGITGRDDELFMVLALDGAHTNFYSVGILYFTGTTAQEVTSARSWKIAKLDGLEKLYSSNDQAGNPRPIYNKGIKGPGVAALAPCNSGLWMFYHSKKHDHFERTSSSDYAYERRIMLQEIDWTTYDNRLIPSFYAKQIVGVGETGTIQVQSGHTEDPTMTGIDPGIYKLTAKHSGKALTCDASGSVDPNVVQLEYSNQKNQIWHIIDVGEGYYRIENILSGKVLSVRNSSLENGSGIHQLDWNNGDNQKWQVDEVEPGYYRIIAKHSKKVVDIAENSLDDNGIVHQWDWLNGNNQKWQIEEVEIPLNYIQKQEKQQIFQCRVAGTNLTLLLRQSSNINVDIFDVNGKITDRQKHVSLAAGTYHFRLNKNVQAHGVHVIRIAAKDKSVQMKMVFSPGQ